MWLSLRLKYVLAATVLKSSWPICQKRKNLVKSKNVNRFLCKIHMANFHKRPAKWQKTRHSNQSVSFASEAMCFKSVSNDFGKKIVKSECEEDYTNDLTENFVCARFFLRFGRSRLKKKSWKRFVTKLFIICQVNLIWELIRRTHNSEWHQIKLMK